MQLPSYLPIFLTESEVLPETGKQDKIEIEINGWTAWGSDEEQIDCILKFLGAPPPVYQGKKRTRTRQNHGNAYGWIFNTINTSKLQAERTVDIRKTQLEIEHTSAGAPPPIAPPLFSGKCKWKVADAGGVTPWKLIGKLDLSINPTRFVRHRPAVENLPKGIQARESIFQDPYGEVALDGNDNWLPLSGRLQAAAIPEKWQHHISRYLNGIVEAVRSEIERVCVQHLNQCDTGSLIFNVKRVETYWEWISPDPVLLIRDLERYFRTFSGRYRGKRTYEATESGINVNMPILQIQIGSGEWLKVYAKTNHRIRIEITHKLTGRDRFQFPRQRNSAGQSHRPSTHAFKSTSDVLLFFDRLRTRAAKIVNDFLRHIASQAKIASSHISGYDALLNIAYALSSNHTAAFTLTSLLINHGCVSMARWPEHISHAITALRSHGIIEPVAKRRVYVVTEPYRHALEMLCEHASFPILIAKGRTRRRNTPA